MYRSIPIAADSVRIAKPEMSQDIVDMMVGANEQYRADMPAEIFKIYLEDLRMLPDRKDVQCAVAVLDRAVVGAVAYRSTARSPAGDVPGHASFRALSVLPCARGRGFGRALAHWAIGRARVDGARGVAIHAALFQTAARQLYHSLGFVRGIDLDFDVADVVELATVGTSMPVFGLRLDLHRFAEAEEPG